MYRRLFNAVALQELVSLTRVVHVFRHITRSQVPNHVARDHEWIATNPEFFVQVGGLLRCSVSREVVLDMIGVDSHPQGTEAAVTARPEGFYCVGSNWIAHGRDPNYPAWTDTVRPALPCHAVCAHVTSVWLTRARTLVDAGPAELLQRRPTSTAG